MQVNAAGGKDLYNAIFGVSYDPQALVVSSQAQGPLLQKDGVPASFQAFDDHKKGLVWISESRQDGTGITGDGSLATITFKPITKGSTALGLTNTTFTTKDGSQIPVTAFRSVVEVK